MPITLLLDLDDTLLETNTEVFVPTYYSALAENLSDLIPPDAMLGALRTGVKQMMLSHDPARTLQQVFEAEFYPRLDVASEPLRQRLMRFYREVFPTLGSATRQRPGARELVDWAVAAGHHVALATDPLFPLVATEERVRWAGLDPARFELISSFETFHFTKTHPAYFAEMLGRLGWPDEPVVMAGNDVERDLRTAARLGPDHLSRRDGRKRPYDRSGNLADLRQWIEANASSLKPPAFDTSEAVVAVLEASPAVLQSMTAGLTAEEWSHEASPEDWAMVELVCHLRDTEREVHAQQINVLLEAATPFVSRPDAAVWAKQRKYLNEDGDRAVNEFAAARGRSAGTPASGARASLVQTARHAIFGPSTFLEVIGFMAEHDRLHLRQAWRTLVAARMAAHRN